MTSEYIDANQKLWDEWTEAHLGSEFYGVEEFKKGGTSLHALEIDDVGDVRGKTLLHLQCHFGQDTLSWARLGATVTGLDLSPRGIEAARTLAAEIGIDDATFVQSDLMEADRTLPPSEQFDVVYTGGGAIGWLPELATWGSLIARYLKPGGIFYIREFHPIAWLFDDSDGATELGAPMYPYFRADAPIVTPVEGSYADPSAKVTVREHYSWAHSFDEIFGSLLEAGLRIAMFKEHRHVRQQLFPWLEQADDGNWYAKGSDIPLMFSLKALKPNR